MMYTDMRLGSRQQVLWILADNRLSRSYVSNAGMDAVYVVGAVRCAFSRESLQPAMSQIRHTPARD